MNFPKRDSVRELVRRALRGIGAVYHLAAKEGVGQSMYQIADYTAVNNEGTAVLLIAHRLATVVSASLAEWPTEGADRQRNGAGEGVHRGRTPLSGPLAEGPTQFVRAGAGDCPVSS